jgi:2-oxoglutarate ferredoxin oxidoreductase subunit delta
MSRIVIDEGRCKGCALCTHVCPHNLVHIATRFNSKGYQPAEFVDPESECTACANCATMCPDLAITVYRTSPGARHTRQGTARAHEPTPPRTLAGAPSDR